MFGPIPTYDPLLDTLPLAVARNLNNGNGDVDDGSGTMENNNDGGNGGFPDLPEEPSFDNMNRAALLAWQERQRRQRTLRMLTMFLMALLLMDGEEPPDARHHRAHRRHHLRKRDAHWEQMGYLDGDGNLVSPLKPEVYGARIEEDEIIRQASRENKGSRYHELVKRNDGRDVEEELRKRVGEKLEGEAVKGMVLGDLGSEDGDPGDGGKKSSTASSGRDAAALSLLRQERLEEEIRARIEEELARKDKERRDKRAASEEERTRELDDLTVFHYPRNATGYYRGLWVRSPSNGTARREGGGKEATVGGGMGRVPRSDTANYPERNVTAGEMHMWAQAQLYQRDQDVALMFLPPNAYFELGDAKSKNSTPAYGGKATKMKDIGWRDSNQKSPSASSTADAKAKPPALSLTKDAGRAAFQLYSRPVPAMSELSIVDGLVKLYDGMATSFVSRRTDVLLRVRGVMVHGCGRVSLVTAAASGGAAAKSGADAGRRRTFLGVRQVLEDRREGGAPSTEFRSEDGEVTEPSEDEEGEEDVDGHRRRRLEELQSAVKGLNGDRPGGFTSDVVTAMARIRRDVMDLYTSHYVWDEGGEFERSTMEEDGWSLLQTVDEGDWSFGDSDGDLGSNTVDNFAIHRRKLEDVDEDDDASSVDNDHDLMEADGVARSASQSASQSASNTTGYATSALALAHVGNGTEISWRRSTLTMSPHTGHPASLSSTPHGYVYPYPYVVDDANDSITKAGSPATRNLPHRERVLEANAERCEFEINVDVHATPWTYGEWRSSMEHRLRMGVGVFNPYWNVAHSVKLKRSQYLLVVKSQLDFLEDQQPPSEALVMMMTGDIHSENCDFRSFVNVTAMRTNWEHTTAKAINYSFYMMLVCLTQIVILLRQLLHTQSQSVATNVSLLCIGWQTVLDAILCISHIFLCLVMQPLFTAFASVAFFKLLIFCVIEMKYMAIILQARNNANNTGLTQEDLRRQITLLHLKFYGALMFAIVGFWYLGQTNRTMYIILLYSFWVPQILLNIITESRKPMHPYYMYGMSLTRSVAPMYVFAVRNNFLKEVNPDFPTEPRMCQLLILWLAIQTAILFAQSKYGTRFMIPQRFLPPKFDYSRPIPPSLLPRPAVVSNSPTNGSIPEIELGPLLNSDAVSPTRERSNGVTRNRRGGGVKSRRDSRSEDSTTGVRTTASMSEDTRDTPTLDCVICYNEIDVNDRQGYMLAPCDHIFHRHCLEQWMEVKMECPICRCNLPSL